MDNRILLSKGISESDWSVWKLAQKEDWGNGNDAMLTPESIMRIADDDLKAAGFANPERTRFEAMRKLLGAVSEEVDMAVISPGARERMVTGAGLQRENVERGGSQRVSFQIIPYRCGYAPLVASNEHTFRWWASCVSCGIFG